MTKNAVYDESKVKTLSSLEHIRLRTGMYIGRLGDGGNLDDGIYILLKEVIDNAVDEYIMGFGRKIDIQIKKGLVKVRDLGRGIPLGKVIDCVSVINTGGNLYGGGTAAGRRVDLPWGGNVFDINSLNAAGLLIVRRS